MKTTLLLSLLLTSLTSFAAIHPFDALEGYHHTVVDNSDEYTLLLEKQSGNKARVGQILGDYLMNREAIDGVNTFKVNLHKDTQISYFVKKTLGILLKKQYERYFCHTFPGQLENMDVETCREHTKIMLNQLAKGSDTVFVAQIDGDYYGDWKSVLVIGLDYDKQRSVSLEFDLLHEI